MASNAKQRVYLGGDYTIDLEPILQLIDPKVVVIHQYPSMFDMMSKEAYNPMSVICRQPLNQLEEHCIREIVAAAQARPVLVFGMLAY